MYKGPFGTWIWRRCPRDPTSDRFIGSHRRTSHLLEPSLCPPNNHQSPTLSACTSRYIHNTLFFFLLFSLIDISLTFCCMWAWRSIHCIDTVYNHSVQQSVSNKHNTNAIFVQAHAHTHTLLKHLHRFYLYNITHFILHYQDTIYVILMSVRYICNMCNTQHSSIQVRNITGISYIDKTVIKFFYSQDILTIMLQLMEKFIPLQSQHWQHLHLSLLRLLLHPVKWDSRFIRHPVSI